MSRFVTFKGKNTMLINVDHVVVCEPQDDGQTKITLRDGLAFLTTAKFEVVEAAMKARDPSEQSLFDAVFGSFRR